MTAWGPPRQSAVSRSDWLIGQVRPGRYTFQVGFVAEAQGDSRPDLDPRASAWESHGEGWSAVAPGLGVRRQCQAASASPG